MNEEIISKVNCRYSLDDIKLDLDDMYLFKIKKSDRYVEVLFMKVYEKSFYDYLNSFKLLLKDGLEQKIKSNLESIIRFYDINNKITKTIGIYPKLTANFTFPTKPRPITHTISYLNLIKYWKYKSGIHIAKTKK